SLPPTVLALDGAELIVCVSASPARDFREGGLPGSVIRWEGLARGVAQEHGVFVAVSQLVGSEGGKLFPGCSMAFGPDGQELVRGPFLDEGVATTSLEGAQLDRARGGSPLLADLEQMLPHLREALE
ncbi:MAG: beta-ureidopropionase, partial [Gemmatimonadetes bacterium]|nr:beta-ureidopropionase [Gemmatimonadota bacterium]NIV61952.1 beta-ureidopropionase [Gemmatimonadota bacterium]NIX40012.1 beta-ureidopropionase [Gemmatimonadota bacterium]